MEYPIFIALWRITGYHSREMKRVDVRFPIVVTLVLTKSIARKMTASF